MAPSSSPIFQSLRCLSYLSHLIPDLLDSVSLISSHLMINIMPSSRHIFLNKGHSSQVKKLLKRTDFTASQVLALLPGSGRGCCSLVRFHDVISPRKEQQSMHLKTSFCFIWGHTLWCLDFTLASVFSLVDSGEHIGCQNWTIVSHIKASVQPTEISLCPWT